MKILVIGRQGQLAQSLLEDARKKSLDLLALGRPDVDLLVPASLDRVFARHDPDIVINAAAYTDVDSAERDPVQSLAINRDGAGHLADACASYRKPLIHISTDFVFDGTKNAPYTEEDPVNPINVYGRTKLEGEQRVALSLKQYMIVRTSWVYSPFGRNFVKSIFEQVLRGDVIRVVNDQSGCPTYAPHLASAILDVAASLPSAELGERAWGVFHAAGAGGASRYDLACEILERMGRSAASGANIVPVRSEALPVPPCRPPDSRLDCRKLTATYGLTLPDWRNGIADCVERLASNLSMQSTGQAG